MVKHGRNKKRRAGRIGKVKLKNRTWTRWNPKPTFGDATVKAKWDKEKTPKQNLENMGLAVTPNHKDQVSKGSSIIELFDVPESDQPSRKERYPLNAEEEEYIAKCLEKYGDDYQAMFRDTKTNYLQHTEHKLKKLGARFLLLNAEQRRVPVPEKVKDLLLSESRGN